MADDATTHDGSNEDSSLSYHGAGQGPDSEPDLHEPGTEVRTGAYVSEDDDAEIPDDGGQGGDPADESEEDEGAEPASGARQKAPTAAELEARVREKEQQAHGLTIALQREREAKRRAEDRFYQLVERAMAHSQGAAAAEGEEAGDEPEEPEIDPTDPVARLERKIDRVAQKLEEKEEAEAEAQDQQTVDDALAWVRADQVAVLEKEPAFPLAAEFVAQKVRAQIGAALRFYNPGADEEEIAAAVEERLVRDTSRIQVMCLQRGVSYAQAVLETARGMGWQPPGGGAAPGKPAGRRTSPTVEAERAARSAGTSLGHVGSPPPRRQPNAHDALNMDDDDFAKLLESGQIDVKVLAEQLASGGRR